MFSTGCLIPWKKYMIRMLNRLFKISVQWDHKHFDISLSTFFASVTIMLILLNIFGIILIIGQTYIHLICMKNRLFSKDRKIKDALESVDCSDLIPLVHRFTDSTQLFP